MTAHDTEVETLDAWLAAMPPHVALIVRAMPPCDANKVPVCYRGKDNPLQHYVIVAYTEHGDADVMLKVIHGADSTLPGLGVFGVEPDSLVHCGCGRYQPASDDELELTCAMLARRRGDDIIKRAHEARSHQHVFYILMSVYDSLVEHWTAEISRPVEFWRPGTYTRNVGLAMLAWANEPLAWLDEGADIGANAGAGFRSEH